MKNKIISYLFVLLGLVVIVGSAYVIISYASDIFRAIVDFVTTNDYTKLRECGISTPPQFERIKADLTTVILPFMYLGLPLLLVIISMLMFMGGFYHHKAKHEDETRKTEEMEREMVRKLVKKVETEKAPPAMSRFSEEQDVPEEPSEEEEQAPKMMKKKK
jgi:hypothetical protein